MMRLAESYYHIDNIEENVIGIPENNQQIYSEPNLELLLKNGDIDVGFFYEGELDWNTELRFISLPREIDMSDLSLNSLYQMVSNLIVYLISSLLKLSIITADIITYIN